MNLIDICWCSFLTSLFLVVLFANPTNVKREEHLYDFEEEREDSEERG